MKEINLSGYDDNEDHTRDSVPRPRRAASRVRARRRRPILERPRGAPDQRRRRLPRGPPARRVRRLRAVRPGPAAAAAAAPELRRLRRVPAQAANAAVAERQEQLASAPARATR